MQGRNFSYLDTQLKRLGGPNFTHLPINAKVKSPEIRSRMLAHLPNIHAELAQAVAAGLNLPLPEAPAPARTPDAALPPSPALSTLLNGPGNFRGRKLGLLVTDGADAGLVTDLQAAAQAVGAAVEIVAPAICGVSLSDGTHLPADEKIEGAPSALYDAVAVVASEAGADRLAAMHVARAWVAEAYATAKFIAYAGEAWPLFDKAGLPAEPDGGMFGLAETSAEAFLQAWGALRFWDRVNLRRQRRRAVPPCRQGYRGAAHPGSHGRRNGNGVDAR